MIIKKPFRLRILIALTELLRGICPANGYQFDLAGQDEGEQRVVRGRLVLGDREPEFMVSLIEPPNAVEPVRSRGPDNRGRATEWDVLIQGWARDDDDNEDCDLAYGLAADVHKALATVLRSKAPGRVGAPDFLGFGPRITDFKIGTPVIRPSEEVSGYGCFYTILTMQIVEDIAEPFG